MPYALLVVALVVTVVFLVLGSGMRVRAEEPGTPAAARPPVVVQTAGDKTTRGDLARALPELGQKPAPEKLAMGAMCYKPAGPPELVTYVCPGCGEKTVYATRGQGGDRQAEWGQTMLIHRDLVNCRRVVKEITNPKVELDESQFCKKCSPAQAKPQLGLVIHYPDQSEPHRVWGVSLDDLRLLQEFFAGKDRHVTDNDQEVAMKDCKARLEKLLGVTPLEPAPK